MQGSLKEQLKQKFRNGRRPNPAHAKESNKENHHRNEKDVNEPPMKKQKKQCATKSRIGSEGTLHTINVHITHLHLAYVISQPKGIMISQI